MKSIDYKRKHMITATVISQNTHAAKKVEQLLKPSILNLFHIVQHFRSRRTRTHDIRFWRRTIVRRKSQQNQLTRQLPMLVSATKSLGKMPDQTPKKWKEKRNLSAPTQINKNLATPPAGEYQPEQVAEGSKKTCNTIFTFL